jgi:site-specific DNA-methyltransferase (adenine-specific)
MIDSRAESCIAFVDDPHGLKWGAVANSLKPGSHVAAVCPLLRHHRVVASMEDSGIEVRDCILFLGKPSFLVSLGRVVLEGTVAENVIRYGTGGLNIDVSRVSIEDSERLVVDNRSGYNDGERGGIYSNGLGKRPPGERFKSHEGGRWPPNLILSNSSIILGKFPDAGGGFGVVGSKGSRRGGIMGSISDSRAGQVCGYGDKGSASRFFYNVSEDNSLQELISYLCKLCTPPQGNTLVVGLESEAIIALEGNGFNVFEHRRNFEHHSNE